jgi:coenzyme F420-reducing hydrogenase alpha subunit
MIKYRSLIHNVPIIPIRKYREHIDLFYALIPAGYKFKIADTQIYVKGGLSLHCHYNGIKQMCDVSGKEIPELFKEGKYKDIIDHNIDDVECTDALFRKMFACNLIEDNYLEV